MKTMNSKIMKALFGFLVLFAVAIFNAPTASANDFTGVQSVKAVWNITTGSEEVFIDRMQLIKQTADSLKKRGIKSDFILVIHGKAAKFVTKTLLGTKFAKEKVPNMTKAQTILKGLSNSGSKVEVCSIAMSRANIKPSNVKSFALIQENVFENLIVLQNKGYAYMPVQ